MKNTAGAVWAFLDTHPCIKKDLDRNLINARALAKYIINTNKMDTTLDAVISAIRRYETGGLDDQFTIARHIIDRTVTISTRSGLVEVSLIKNDDIQRSLPALFDIIDHNRGEILRIIQATETIKLIIDEKNLEDISSIFSKNGILKTEKYVAEINMHMHPKMVKTRGILAVISNEMTINGINIIEILSCIPELLIFVKEEDVLKAYQVLYKLCRNHR